MKFFPTAYQRPLLTLVFLCISMSCPAQDEIDATVVDRAPLVIMAPLGPVLADMQISVDGKAYRLWVTEFLASRTDVNRDGELSLDELKLIPARVLQQTTARTAKRILRRATESKDADSVSVDIFSKWLADDLNRSFDVIAGAVQASAAVRLAGLVDENGDGRVSREELVVGAHSMRFRDLDDDQTFSAAELLPYRDPRNQQAAVVPDAADLPFVQLSDVDSIKRAAKQIMNRYGNDGKLALEKLRLPKSVGENLDATLTEKSCAEFLKNPHFHLTAGIKLSDRPNASTLQIAIADSAADFCRFEPGRRGRGKLIIDDMPIDTRARGGGVKTRNFLVALLLQRVSIYDADKSGYLSEDEFPQMQQQMAQQSITADFASADLNSDGMIFRDELKMFIERDAIATQSRIEVSIRQDGTTLFKLLDANVDRRLTQRELKEGFDVLLEYDLDKDDQLSESELGTAYALEIGLGQAASLRMDSMMQNMNMGMQATDAVLPGVSGLDGPEWFRRMDRNQDRDVSAREFLGPREIFTKLDTDNDGLLSATEAEAL